MNDDREKYILISPIIEPNCKEGDKLAKSILNKVNTGETITRFDLDEYIDVMNNYFQNARDQLLMYYTKIEVLESFYKDDELFTELQSRKEACIQNMKTVDEQWVNFKVDWRSIRDEMTDDKKQAYLMILSSRLEDDDENPPVKH